MTRVLLALHAFVSLLLFEGFEELGVFQSVLESFRDFEFWKCQNFRSEKCAGAESEWVSKMAHFSGFCLIAPRVSATRLWKRVSPKGSVLTGLETGGIPES